MTQGFDEWLKSKKIRTDKDGRDYIDGFARASHCGWLARQAEVDSLKLGLEILQEMHNAVSLTAFGLVDERDELQDTVKSLNKNIEALHVENEKIQKQYQMMFECVQGRQQTIDELQKRIDDALKALEKLDGYDYNENLDAVFLILKGESNE